MLSDELKAVKAVIATRETWTTDSYAEDADGKDISAFNPKACKFCVVGAVSKVADTPAKYAELQLPLSIKAHTLYGQSLVTVNDYKGFDAVHKVLDAAIAEAEQNETK